MIIGIGFALAAELAGQEAPPLRQGEDALLRAAGQATVLILVGDGGGQLQSVNAGVIIRQDGVLLTAYHPLKNAQEVQVRLRDGEVYDQAELMGFDERRDVAALHIPAFGLPVPPLAALSQAAPGARVQAIAITSEATWAVYDGILNEVKLADDVPGAGQGYRVIQFAALRSSETVGGVLLDSQAKLLGIITVPGNSTEHHFAVPVESVLGLAGEARRAAFGSGSHLSLPASSAAAARTQVEDARPVNILAKARTLWVTSRTRYFTPFMLAREVTSRAEFQKFGLNVVADRRAADLIVEVDRPLFTYDFTFTIMEQRTSAVVAVGKVTAIDGPHAAAGIAKKILQDLANARAVQAAQVM
jgi:hypothetical protein